MVPKRRKLPKDFGETLQRGSFDDQVAVFSMFDVDARGSYLQQSALAFQHCSDKLTNWLVDNGADLEATDKYGAHPLHSRAARGSISALIARGANVNAATPSGQTPLHEAAIAYNTINARLLLDAGANPNATNSAGLTPLDAALQQASNANIAGLVEIAKTALAAGGKTSPDTAKFITKLGEQFEFFRADMEARFSEQSSLALAELYTIFEVPPVPRLERHSGTEPIVVQGATPGKRFDHLWKTLVPGRGSAETVQGEVIRIAGRIEYEISGNGGVNWDDSFAQMCEAFVAYTSSGNTLDPADASDVAKLTRQPNIDLDFDGLLRLIGHAVAWVERNPNPIPLEDVPYQR